MGKKNAGALLAAAYKREFGNVERRLEPRIVPIAPPSNVASIHSVPVERVRGGRGAHISALNEACRRNYSDAHLRAVLDPKTGLGYFDFEISVREKKNNATPADLERLKVLCEEMRSELVEATKAKSARIVPESRHGRVPNFPRSSMQS